MPLYPRFPKNSARSIAITYLRQSLKPDSKRDLGVACLYFDHKPDYEPIEILKFLLKEMDIRKGTVSKDIHVLYREHEMRDSTPPSRAETVEVFANKLNKFKKYFCIIDGLDEANENSREALLQHFQPKLRLMVTGRPYVEDVPKLFAGCEILKISSHDSDIEMFVEGELQKDRFLRTNVATDIGLKKLVVDTNIEKAKGITSASMSVIFSSR